MNACSRALKMLTVVGCPRLTLYARMMIFIRCDAPAVSVAETGAIAAALYHQRILRMHKRTLDFGRFRCPESVEAAHDVVCPS